MLFEDFCAKFEKRTATSRGVMVKCPAHEDRQASLSISRASDGGVLLRCFANCKPEAIVAAMSLSMRDLFAEEKKASAKDAPNVWKPKAHNAPKAKEDKTNYTIETTYSYTDALDREVYQAVRLKPKSFRQRHHLNGEWVWSMEGIERVLYRLPEVMKAKRVWIVEGEKDADNLASLGICATTNVGGAGKWLDGYSAALRGKDVVICGDNDKPGQDHVALVFDSLAEKAATVKIVKVPAPHKDISDWITSFAKPEDAAAELDEVEKDAVPHVAGVRMPIYSMGDIEPRYHKMVTHSKEMRIDLSRWLPSFRAIRPLTPGSMVLFMADTGIGKTIILQNIAMAFAHMKTLMFEMELPDVDMFERFMANMAQTTCEEVEKEYIERGCFGEAMMQDKFPNLFICPESGLTLGRLEKIISRADLKMGGKPFLVLLDYAQLLKKEDAKTRYEGSSSVAEGVKVLAKDTGTIIIVTSQIDRQSARTSIDLHSAKDTGSWENSAGVVVGARRDEKEAGLMHLKVFKSTKGGAGLEVQCNFDGAKTLITERSKTGEIE